MLDFSFGEIALVVLVALLVVGPKDLPVMLRTIGRWFGQFKSITDEFKEGFRSAMEDTSLDEMKKDMNEIHEEIKYITDDQGRLQRVYDPSTLVDHSKITTTATKES